MIESELDQKDMEIIASKIEEIIKITFEEEGLSLRVCKGLH